MYRIIARALFVVSLTISAWFFMSFGKDSTPFYGDAMGYYLYLPSTFIYHNFDNLASLPADRNFDPGIREFIAAYKAEGILSPKGYVVDKYTYGVALLELPFFLIAHTYEHLTGGQANGYSSSYKWLIKIATIFYALLGLILIYRILSFFFSRDTSLISTLVIFLGTNLFWFTLYQSGMAHTQLFFLFALLIYTTIRLHLASKKVWFMLSGLTAGLIIVIRPTDSVCLLIPLLYNVYNFATLKQKVQLLRAHYKDVLLFVLFLLIPFIPQMIYWKLFAGRFIYYSYSNEHFNWMNPRILDGLFSGANGWLIYSPVMIFSVAGIFLFRKFKPGALVIPVILPLYIYVIYSWYCYNYINGLGSRPMVDIYALLAIPLAAFIAKAAGSNRYLKSLTLLLVIFFTAVNVTYSIQQPRHILFSEESNLTYNIHMLLKTSANYNDLITSDLEQVQPDSHAAEKVTTLMCRNYDDSLSDRYVADPTGKSKFVYHIHSEDEYHPQSIVVTYHQAIFKGCQWIRCSGDFMCPQQSGYYRHIMTVDIKRGDKTLKWNGCKIDNKIGLADGKADPSEYTFAHNEINKWGDVYFFYKLPDNLKDGDQIRLDIWNVCRQEMFMDNLCMDLYKTK